MSDASVASNSASRASMPIRRVNGSPAPRPANTGAALNKIQLLLKQIHKNRKNRKLRLEFHQFGQTHHTTTELASWTDS